MSSAMDFDDEDDDAPLTFRRSAPSSTPDKLKGPRQEATPDPGQSGSRPGLVGSGPRENAEPISANGNEEDKPLAARAARHSPAGSGGGKRSANLSLAEGNAQAKRPRQDSKIQPKAEPNHISQTGTPAASQKGINTSLAKTGSVQPKTEANQSTQKAVSGVAKLGAATPARPAGRGVNVGGAKAPSGKPGTGATGLRAPDPPMGTVKIEPVRNGKEQQYVQRHARQEVKYKEESEEEEEEDGDDGEEEEEESEEEEEDGEEEEGDDDEVPLSARSAAVEGSASKRKKPESGRRVGGAAKSLKGRETSGRPGGGRGGKKEDSGAKWNTLSHNGVVFPPPYTPHGIKILYKGKPVDLTPEQEEVATMFAVMRETEYISKPKFLTNFWEDWRAILGARHVIQKLDLCDFTPIWEWHCAEKEKKKQMTAEEKKKIKQEKEKTEEKYMWAVIDGKKEKVGNFRVEPPGLFRGRGEHPKMGKLKRRIVPEDITINIGKEAPVPECPIPGHRWREVRHDNTVTWLAYWCDPINPREFKYVFLAASSTLKGLSDKEKYEKARKLKDHIEQIRRTYVRNFSSQDKTARQIAVATYLIDRLALRAGNEKDDDEADTVGCCSLKVEHCTQVPPSSLQFDFLGKDSIRYFNTVEVVPEVYKAIGDFSKGKQTDEDLFDLLDTSKLNAHLKELMPGLTAKVFRTYNASITLDNLLQDTVGDEVKEKIADYQRANKEVAILCNHQRAVSKAHSASMERLQQKVQEVQTKIEELEEDLVEVRKGRQPIPREGKDTPSRGVTVEGLEKKINQEKAKVQKMTLDMSMKEELKTVALGTSKINYMDPRITIAWCKEHEVPIEKIFNKSLLAKFAWAMDVEPGFRF